MSGDDPIIVNVDGSFTVNFGDCEAGRKNCLFITDGWSYVVRLYQPRKEILSGEGVSRSPGW